MVFLYSKKKPSMAQCGFLVLELRNMRSMVQYVSSDLYLITCVVPFEKCSVQIENCGRNPLLSCVFLLCTMS